MRQTAKATPAATYRRFCNAVYVTHIIHCNHRLPSQAVCVNGGSSVNAVGKISPSLYRIGISEPIAMKLDRRKETNLA